MADTIIDRLFIAFGLKADGVKQGMDKAEGIVKNGLSSIKSYLMPLATGFALSSMVQGFVDGAAQIGKAAEFLGMSIEDLQAWQGAAEAMGAEGAEVNEMIMDMNEHLVDMVQFGSGPAVDVLNKLGIAAKDAKGNIRPATDVLLDLAEASERVSKQEMLAYGRIMGFDKSVIDMLMQGKKGLQELLKAQKELAVFQKEDALLAQKGRVAWQGLMKALQSIQAVIMRFIMPALTLLTTWLTKAVIWARENKPFMIALITGFALAITAILLPAIFKLAAAGIAAMAPWLPLIGIITAAALLVDDFWTYLEGGESALAPVWAYLIKFFGFFETSIEGAKKYWQAACEFFSAIFEGNFAKAGQSLINMFAGVIQVFFGLWQGIGTYILDLLNTITGGAVDAFKAKFTAMLDWAKDTWNGIKSFFGFGSNEGAKTSSAENILPPMELEHKTPLYSVSPEEIAKINAKAGQHQTNNINTSASIGNITINTQATDAYGIAKSLRPELTKEISSLDLVTAANTGVVAK